jgi:thiamine thiazole synthase
MSPPAATFDSAVSPVLGNGLPVKKDLAVKTVGNGQTKTLADMEDKWELFTFSPIRESQVSRAMSMNPIPFISHTLTFTHSFTSSPLLRRPR